MLAILGPAVFARRDDAETLARFSDKRNEHDLFIEWLDYQSTTRTLPVEAQAFQAWYFHKPRKARGAC
jgi:hypothetical protein